jgi:S-formylglutathione hydrolase FrmB
MVRRRLVAGAAVLAVAVAAWLFTSGSGRRLLGKADQHGAQVATLTVDSKAVGRQLAVKVVVPAKARNPAPLLVFLHGRTGNESSELDSSMFAALAKLGARAPIIAFPNGGDHSYWHDRADGKWGTYVTGEVIPQVEHLFKVDPSRVAIGGISMGGFGAFDLARQNPGRFCAVGGHSPAIWENGGETAPGAFDDAEDFARNDVVGSARTDPGAIARQPIWLDAGNSDPFLRGDAALVSALQAGHADLTVKHWPGGHTHGYWSSHWNDYLSFYAGALQHCRHYVVAAR